jgi:hypothetical protein
MEAATVEAAMSHNPSQVDIEPPSRNTARGGPNRGFHWKRPQPNQASGIARTGENARYVEISCVAVVSGRRSASCQLSARSKEHSDPIGGQQP